MPLPPKGYLLGGPVPVPGARSAPARVGSVRRSWTGSSAASSLFGSAAAPPPRAAKAATTLPRVPRLPETPSTPPEGYTGDTINDALDDLLREAAASLKHLDGIRAKLKPKQGATRHNKKSDVSGFWKPRCRADLWGDDELWSDLDSEFESELDSDDGASSADVDVEEEELWGFLRSACKAEPAGPANRGTAKKAPGPRYRASAKAQQSQPQPPPKPRQPSKEAPPRRADASADRAAPRGGEEKPAEGPAERARANGFRFGTYGASAGASGSARATVPVDLQKPEAQISAALVSAQAEGPDAVRSTLKRLLLKWHPDKAPQGDNPEAVAARAESTRVLRHVLQERQRLGL